jgi:1-phosphofructokinase family hexose kinase
VILAAGLTPAWQQIMLLDAFRPGQVNRATQVHWCASGKVLNVAVALHHLGAACKVLSPAGGLAGQEMRRQFQAMGIAARWLDSAAPTRVCTTLLEGQSLQATELVENASPLGPGELDAFVLAYAEEARQATWVVLSGSLPQGTPPSFYRDLLRQTPGGAILDARGPELLQALEMRPFLIKPNREELGKTVGQELIQDDDLFQAMRDLHQRGAAWVVVTDGKNPVHVLGEGKFYQLMPPSIAVVNPIGSGDCLAAGLAWALSQERDHLQAIRYGMAAAAENAGQLLPARLSPERVERLVGQLYK